MQAKGVQFLRRRRSNRAQRSWRARGAPSPSPFLFSCADGSVPAGQQPSQRVGAGGRAGAEARGRARSSAAGAGAELGADAGARARARSWSCPGLSCPCQRQPWLRRARALLGSEAVCAPSLGGWVGSRDGVSDDRVVLAGRRAALVRSARHPSRGKPSSIACRARCQHHRGPV